MWDDLFIPEEKLKLCFIFQNFLKWPPFAARDELFLPEVIPGVEYTRKIAISISDILSL